MIRPTTLLIVLLAVSLSLTLFTVKYQVQDLEEQLVQINRSITDDRQAIHVLKAEWSHLNEPTRLRILAERYLGMTAIDSRQVGTAAEMLPRISEIETGPVTPLTASVAIQEPRQ
jgi:cell division protein FtsL